MKCNLLDDFRALDLTDDKGFLCGKILADMGVDVIKVEKPGGDPSRNIPPYYHDQNNPEKSINWFVFNANKRGITLNLETKQGQDIFNKLISKIDYVIESFEPGYMASLRLDYKELSILNPRLIMTSITPFGQTGPYAHYKASDLVVQAFGALLSQAGEPDRAPIRTTVPQAFMHAGSEAAEATLMATYYRDMSDEGQYVDVSAMESVLWVAGRSLPWWDASKTELKRSGNQPVRSKLKSPILWECKDGFVALGIGAGKTGVKPNKSLTAWMASENMAPDYMMNKDWENWDMLKTTQEEMDIINDAVAAFLKTRTADEIQAEATKRDIILHKVCDSSDTVKNTQLKARDFWVDLKHDELNDLIRYPGAFAKFSKAPIQISRRAPLVGEHNEEIYCELLGFSKNELKHFKKDNVI